jgi:hypothetical protein
MKLTTIMLPPDVAKGMDALQRMKTLVSINNGPAKDFWQKYERGEFKQLKP